MLSEKKYKKLDPKQSVIQFFRDTNTPYQHVFYAEDIIKGKSYIGAEVSATDKLGADVVKFSVLIDPATWKITKVYAFHSDHINKKMPIRWYADKRINLVYINTALDLFKKDSLTKCVSAIVEKIDDEYKAQKNKLSEGFFHHPVLFSQLATTYALGYSDVQIIQHFNSNSMRKMRAYNEHDVYSMVLLIKSMFKAMQFGEIKNKNLKKLANELLETDSLLEKNTSDLTKGIFSEMLEGYKELNESKDVDFGAGQYPSQKDITGPVDEATPLNPKQDTPEEDTLEKKSISELKKLAKQKGIKVTRKSKKEDLTKAIREAEENKDDDDFDI
jgi:hypothetical protein